MSSHFSRPMTRLRHSVRSVASGAGLLVALALPSAAAAQTAAAAPAQATPASPAPAAPVAGWSNGFLLQTANGDNRLQIGGLVQLDGRFSLDTSSPFVDTFVPRKVRAVLAGRVGKYFDFRLMPDFGGGTTTVLDAYFDIRFSPKFRVRTGKDKTPIGYELLIQDSSLLFPERALASSLVPNRDVGVQAQGDLANGKIYYAGGVFNGMVDGANSTADVDTNNGKDLAGRLVLQPFRKAPTSAGPLNGLGVQIGGSTGTEAGALPSFKTSAGIQTYFSYAGASGTTPAAVANGDRTRITPSVFYFYKSLGTFAEYIRTTQAISRGAGARDITNQGWEVTGSWFITGETASTGLPSPRKPFDPAAGKWGALQLLARYSELTVDQAAFDQGFAAAGSSRIARAATIAANWYPVQFVKYYLTFEHASFDGPTPRPTENTILFRAQIAF